MAGINREARAQSGQALIGVTLSLTFLFAVMGLSIDLGWAYYLKSQVQTAADAAATAAAVYANTHLDACATVSCGVAYRCAGVSPATTSLQAGCLYATADGPPNSTATMIENDSTVSPGVTGNSPLLWVKATVSTTAPNFFLFGSGFHISNISAQAIAGLSKMPPAACIYVLSASAAQALSVTGSSSVTTTGCGVFINSSSSTAMYVTGSSHITSTKIVLHCTGCYQITGSSYTSPASPYTVGPVSDPLASLPAPTYGACDHTSNVSVGNANTATLNPGVYCGGITVTGAARVTLNPGVYILNGGGLNVSNSGILTGSHVMFYNTGSSGHTPGPVTINGSAVVTLTAPDSGVYQGIAFFQDRTLTYASVNTIANAGTGNITGTYYFPTTAFNFTGSTNASTTAAFVASTVTVSGSSTLANDTTGTVTGLARNQVSLIQ